MPDPASFDRPDSVSPEVLKEILSVDVEGWKKEIADVRENHYPKFGDHLPKELMAELEAIEKRLG
jgi:phosphoenolpyruvate carboxykinase (GTP)